jgi:hypothetical protein
MAARQWATLGIVAALLAWSGPAVASILDFKQLVIDLTDAADARAKATWSEQGPVAVTDGGLGWDGEVAASYDGWIETVPLAVGLSWRPAIGVSVRVSLRPGPRPFTLANGQSSSPSPGMVFVRYSPDLRHWSTWQAMSADEGTDAEGARWAAVVQVPRTEREEYEAKLEQYMRLDVPWKSDEEAAVKWMVAKQKDFFARHLPLVGYVQVRYEGRFHGGRRLTGMNVDVSAGIGGLHMPPRDPAAAEGREGPWRFDGRRPRSK